MLLGFTANAPGVLGARDARFAAVMAPFVAPGNMTELAALFATILLFAFAAIAPPAPSPRSGASRSAAASPEDSPLSLRRTTHFETRCVLCDRPTVVTGGRAHDILALRSGEKFEVPFDTRVIFSTNFHPNEIFDGAALRLVFFKIKVDGSSRENFVRIFDAVVARKGLPLCPEPMRYLLDVKYPEIAKTFANYQPVVLIDQTAICGFEGLPLQMRPIWWIGRGPTCSSAPRRSSSDARQPIDVKSLFRAAFRESYRHVRYAMTLQDRM